MIEKKQIILGVIPARAGSKGIKNKNLQSIANVPLIAYTIRQALRYAGIDRVIVTTDSKKIALVAVRYGAAVPFLRPKQLGRDRTPMLAVLKHALVECEKFYACRVKGVVLLDPTSPVREPKEMETMIKMFVRHQPDLLVAVTPSRRSPYFNMLVKETNGYARLISKKKFFRRQDAPRAFDITNTCWIFSRKAILLRQRIPRRTAVYEIKNPYIDIDRKADLERFRQYLDSGRIQ